MVAGCATGTFYLLMMAVGLLGGNWPRTWDWFDGVVTVAAFVGGP
jgi:hypothetical protein